MSIRTTPPPTPVKSSTESIAKELERARIASIYRGFLGLLMISHLIIMAGLSGQGIKGYLMSWRDLFILLLEKPYLAPIIPLALIVLYKGIELWRNSEPNEVVLPEFPPKPDLRFSNDILIGSGWTRNGLQPGEIYRQDSDDELFDADDVHVIMNESGLFGNIQVTGGIGSGKTSSLIQPMIWQAISKYPMPPRPEDFPLGSDGRYQEGEVSQNLSLLPRMRQWLAGSTPPPPPPKDKLEWNPYVGMTTTEAEAEYARLTELHKRKKWGMFVMDPKGDLTEFVLRTAAMAGRSDDVVVLRPDGESTYNPLVINANPGVQAELVMDGIEAVSGQPIQQYWRGTMAEWLENALALLRVVDPTRITFRNILRLARNESLRTHMVSEAEDMMRRAQEEEERLRRLGREYTGVRVDPAAIEFFRDWDDEEADPQLKRAVVSGIKTQSKFFVNSELAPFLCPEMPPTFRGFEQMIDEGQIVVLRMPLDTYGPVARVLGILVMADAQQVARARINREELNQDRVVLFCIDEISAYLNRSTKDFIAMNRQSRVCFLGALQTQGQLVQHGDRGFQDSFRDNLRNKIIFSTPNADAAKKEMSIIGTRQVYRQSITESTTFHRIERLDGDAITPVSPEGASMSVRMDEVERPWFTAEDFMTLKTGECIVMEFDGQTTIPPRKIKCDPFYLSPLYPIAQAQEIDHRIRPPHPVVHLGTQPRDYEYLGSALVQAGYVILEPLADKNMELRGFKFVTDVGTLLASCETLEDLDHALEERLTDRQILVLFTHFDTCTQFFTGGLGLEFERVLSLIDTFQGSGIGSKASTLAELYQEQIGDPLPYMVAGSWEFHSNMEANHDLILDTSRRLIDIFTRLGEKLAELPNEELETMYDATRVRISEALSRTLEPVPADSSVTADTSTPITLEELVANTGEGVDPTESGGPSIIPDDPEAYFATQDDPFISAQFPDELLHALADEESTAPLVSDPDTGQGRDFNQDTDHAAESSREGLAQERQVSSEGHLAPLGDTSPPKNAPTPDPDLLSLQFPASIEEALELADKADEPSAPITSTNKQPSNPGVRNPRRRSSARSDRRAHSKSKDQGTLDPGLTEDTPSRSAARNTGTSVDDGDQNLPRGAPLD